DIVPVRGKPVESRRCPAAVGVVPPGTPRVGMPAGGEQLNNIRRGLRKVSSDRVETRARPGGRSLRELVGSSPTKGDEMSPTRRTTPGALRSRALLVLPLTAAALLAGACVPPPEDPPPTTTTPPATCAAPEAPAPSV